MVVAAAPVLCLFDRVFITLEGVLVQASGCYCFVCEEFSSDYGGRIRLLFLLFSFSFFFFLFFKLFARLVVNVEPGLPLIVVAARMYVCLEFALEVATDE